MKTFAILILMACSIQVLSQEKLEGFRGWNWGVNFNSIQDELIKADVRIPGLKAYHRKGDCSTFEGLKTNEIDYLFKKDVFTAINVNLQKNDLDLLLKIYTDKFGEPIKKDIKAVTHYIWNTNNADIYIKDDPSSKNESITLFISCK